MISKDTLKMIGVVITAAVTASVGTWQASAQTGGNGLSRDEVSRIVRTESPYTRDRSLLIDKLKKIDKVAADVQSLKVNQARLETKIDLLLQSK